ncbi:hypothetical protein [Streptomyces sp. DW26H14]|uniref:hypothetical protein n=1 Tax=Streptomyces sp. DW26H14 TaxID=3435395 RepID=UPI00403DB0FA
MVRKGLAALAGAIGVVAAAATLGATPASADFAHCSAQYFCTYDSGSGQGSPNMQLKDTNPN